MPTGAQRILSALSDCGVRTCFTNPGTSEMHFVAALEAVPDMRAVLCLFEGVATGAADGYARMTGTPAATLLHLGPGLANGLANLHNARRAHSPVVNLIGDHARDHRQLDTPLQSDIEGLAGWLRGSVRSIDSIEQVEQTIRASVQDALRPPSRPATLVIPADVAWLEGEPSPGPAPDPLRPTRVPVDPAKVEQVRQVLNAGGRAVLLLGGNTGTVNGLRAVEQVVRATAARAFFETFPARLARGYGVPAVERLGYLPELARQQLAPAEHLILVGARPPAAFFAYPGERGSLVPEGAAVHVLAAPGEDGAAALRMLGDGFPRTERAGAATKMCRPELADAELTWDNWPIALAAVLPEGAIVSDESNTSGLNLASATSHAPFHDLLTLTGGAIGQGLPLALGASIAERDRPVVALQSDGSALYTISALWTMAREQLNVTTILLNNRAYAILRLELDRVGAEGTTSVVRDLLSLDRPDLDFVAMSEGLGVPAERATTTTGLAGALRRALSEPGPHLIEVVIEAPF